MTGQDWQACEDWSPIYSTAYFLSLEEAVCAECGRPESEHDTDTEPRNPCGLCGAREAREGFTACDWCA